jgi:carbon monoxide dehydrogenase subunit G
MGKTYQSTVINAPAEKVWAAVSDFHDLSWAPNVVQSLDVVGDAGAKDIGAKRLLNGVFAETLLTLDEDGRTFSYSIDDGPPPVSAADVSNYVGVVTVHTVTEGAGGTFVEWSSRWDMNDEAAAEFCHGIYVALLGELKASLE